MYNAFICKDKLYYLFEHSDIPTILNFQDHSDLLIINKNISISDYILHPIKDTVIKNIILQLLILFKILNKYDFVHGYPSSSSILFFNKPCSYKYEKFRVDSPITLKLTNFKYSSITVNNTRYFPESDSNIDLIFDTNVNTFNNLIYSLDNTNTTYYRISNLINYNIINIYMKFSGIPLFNLSYDVYAFMIVLMSDYSFYTSVISNTFSYSLWKSMWILDEFDKLTSYLSDFHSSYLSSSNPDDIFKMLSNFTLRFDILNFLISQF